MASLMDVQPEGYAVDKKFPDIIYVPEDAQFDLHTQTDYLDLRERTKQTIKLLPGQDVRPTFRLPGAHGKTRGKPRLAPRRHRAPKGLLCHKPCTVSGGGKSEISKPITDAILHGPVFVADFKKDFDQVAELIDRDYSSRFQRPEPKGRSPRRWRPERSLGSVIKLLTPDEHDYTAEYNAWLESVPQYLKELVFVVKRYYKPEWNGHWRDHFSVDIINGKPAQRIEVRQPQARDHLPARRLRRGRRLAHVRLAQGFQSGDENSDGG